MFSWCPARNLRASPLRAAHDIGIPSASGMDPGREYHMSLYDTIRCAWHDPAFLVREHDDLIAAAGIMALFFVWAAL